uniref:Palmitoyltransferase n=1 Tax=Anas platyrhynchos TaxID=8839 RepID=A0A8B9T1M5_ANAPL
MKICGRKGSTSATARAATAPLSPAAPSAPGELGAGAGRRLGCGRVRAPWGPVTISSTAEKVVYLVVFHLSFVMFVWSYWKTIFTSPASPSNEFCLSKADKEQYEKEERPEFQQEILRRAANDLPIYTTTESRAIRYCDRCQLIKPDRCHHCSACDICVLKMDHHCLWVNNCVGFSNYKFFLLFLMYSVLSCLFVAATVLQYFIKCWTKELTDAYAKYHILCLFFVAAIAFIGIQWLFSRHCWLVGKNRSTIESFRAPMFRNGPDENGFSLGYGKNLREVFGDEKKYWLLPIFTSLGDGCSFPTRLVIMDPEKVTVSTQTEPAKSSGASQPFHPRPLSAGVPAARGTAPCRRPPAALARRVAVSPSC